MKLDIEHVLFWMDAIRNSQDRDRTLESFWKGQIRSKEWLIKNLEYFIHPAVNKNMNFPLTVDIHGGWLGVLSSMLFQSNIPIKSIRSIDIDPSCEITANTMNKIEEMAGRFKAVTADMCSVASDADIIINTSCEHITQEQYDHWLSIQNKNSLLVLQGNNYNIPEHIRISNSIEEFQKQCRLTNLLFAAELELPLYKRFMVIGRV